MSSSRPLRKRRSLLERQAPWLIVSVLGALGTAGLALLLDGGWLADYAYFPAILRGYTFTGLLLGVASLVLAGLTFLYSLRKRSLQERMPLGTMSGWLWGHVYLGLSCVVTAFAHAGYGSFGPEPSLGKAALVALVTLVVGGLVWRVLYARVPPHAASEVGHYSQAATRARAEAQLVELEKLAAGRSPALRQMVDWLLRVTASVAEVAHASAAVPPEERALLPELVRLTRARHELLVRERRQGHYRRLLQGARVLHVPVSLLLLLLLPLHVLSALSVPAKVVPPQLALGSTLGGFHPSERCSSCHARVVDEWQSSMHAHALTSPVMVAQNNLAHREILVGQSSPDPQHVCVNCHGPLATALARSPLLPFEAQGALAEAALVKEGVTCSVCHQWRGEPATALAGSTSFQRGLVPGRTFFGRYDDAVGNAYHRSEATELFREPSQLCRNCHSVQYDRNGDGKIERGTDLVLQTLFDEWQDFAKAGGAGCVDCHMPIVPGSRAAETASIPLEQDSEAPPRVLRSHRFVAVDYPIDDPATRDLGRAEREALLRSAGSLAVERGKLVTSGGKVTFEVSVHNSGTGHNLPGGFAFVRQMWLEVSLLDDGGRLLASSGRLARPSDDLCDGTVLDDAESPVREHLVGCSATDRRLVNFQQMLVDKIELLRDPAGVVQLDARGEPRLRRAPGSKEAIVQHLTGGPVPRVRASTGQLNPPLIAGERRAFPYSFDLPPGATARRLLVRLMFRAMPPYFLRALGKTQGPSDGPALAPLVDNLELNEMARVDLAL